MIDLYAILELDKHCSKKDITKALRKLSKIHHPDVGGDPEMFGKIMLAVQILRDPHRKKLYDEHGICFEVSENLIQQEVIGRLKDVIREWIQFELKSGRQYPIKDFMRQKVHEQFSAIQKSNDELNKFIKTLTARKAKITVNEGEINHVHAVIEEQINILKTNLMELEKSRYMVNLIKEVAEKYSSEEIQNMSTGYATGTTTTYFRF